MSATIFRQTVNLSNTHLYAILDGASLANLRAILEYYDLDPVCLYRGELEEDLADYAPYLVQIPADSGFIDLWLEEGWGLHWGILAISEFADLRGLRMHFRKFLMVKDPTGKALYFRYYDPRVLRIYLPTCNADELATIFGPVTAYLVEGETAEALIRFTHNNGQLESQVISLAVNVT